MHNQDIHILLDCLEDDTSFCQIAQKVSEILNEDEVISYKWSPNLIPSTRLHEIYESRLSMLKAINTPVGYKETEKVLMDLKGNVVMCSVSSKHYKIVLLLNELKNQIKALHYLRKNESTEE